jgi:hypothetical protein
MKFKYVNDIPKVSRVFSEKIKRYLNRNQLMEVIRINSIDKDNCHTHHFLDSNILMMDSFEEVNNEIFDMQNEDHIYTWNIAWELSIKNKFYTNFK